MHQSQNNPVSRFVLRLGILWPGVAGSSTWIPMNRIPSTIMEAATQGTVFSFMISIIETIRLHERGEGKPSQARQKRVKGQGRGQGRLSVRGQRGQRGRRSPGSRRRTRRAVNCDDE